MVIVIRCAFLYILTEFCAVQVASATIFYNLPDDYKYVYSSCKISNSTISLNEESVDGKIYSLLLSLQSIQRSLHLITDNEDNGTLSQIEAGDVYNICLKKDRGDLVQNTTRFMDNISMLCLKITERNSKESKYKAISFYTDKSNSTCQIREVEIVMYHPSIRSLEYYEPSSVTMICAAEQFELETFLLDMTYLPKLLGNKNYKECTKSHNITEDMFCKSMYNDTIMRLNTNCTSFFNIIPEYIREINYMIKYCGIFPAISAMFNNIMIVAIFCKFGEMRTAANIYVVSLSAADILLVIQYFLLLKDIKPNPYTVGLEGFALYLVSFTLTTMSIDRFLSIKNSTKLSARTTPAKRKVYAIIIIILSWILSAGLEVIHMFLDKRKESKIGNIIYLSFINGTRFIIPLFIVASMNFRTSRLLRKGAKNFPGDVKSKHSDARMKSSRILMALVLNFIITYTVCYVNLSVQIHYGVSKILLDDDLLLNLSVLERIGEIMYLVNANLNPIILYFCSPIWRKFFHILICCKPQPIASVTTTHGTTQTY